MVETFNPNREALLGQAIHIIKTDNTLFKSATGVKPVTRKDVYLQLFGKKARKGREVHTPQADIHIQGYYEKYPFLNQLQIDGILERHIIQLSTATVITFAGILLDADLSLANAGAKSLHKAQL